jgi:hypothetical protein
MNANSARDDLAFMRALVAAGADSQKTFGEIYATGGLCYGAQMLLHGGQALGVISTASAVSLAVGLGPTVIFLAALIWILSHQPRQVPSATNKAVGAVFGAVGLANLAMVLIIGSVAWRLQSFTVWLIYPCLVMVLQGMAWLVAFLLRRRSWMGVVALGWLLVGVGMGAAIQTMGAYIVVAGVGMVAFMLIPGLVMIRQARQAGG